MTSIVPMQAIPNHSFSCKIPLDAGNVDLRFTMQYNEIAGFWFIDIAKDSQTILAGYPLIPAQDILEQFQYMGIGHAFILPKSDVSSQFPDLETLTSEWYVVWSDDDGNS